MSTALHQPADLIAQVNLLLEEFFASGSRDARNIHSTYERLWRMLHELNRAGGKRLRPYMTLLSYEAFGGDRTDSILPVATAQELLHFSMLIHDDIIDRDYVRYGVPNISGGYKALYGAHAPDEDAAVHFAHSTAVMAGDLMLSAAYKLINESDLEPRLKQRAQELLSKGIFDVAGGELLDMEATFLPFEDASAMVIAKYKTASYSFITPLSTGASLAGASDAQLALLHEFAESTGIAFQLTDDILGTFGDEAMTGKSNTGDIRERKQTLLIETYVASLNAKDRESFMKAFGAPHLSDMFIDTLKEKIAASGARQAVEKEIERHVARAQGALDGLSLPSQYHGAFLELVNKSTKRNS